MKNPCIIITEKEYEENFMIGTKILPGIFVVGYERETSAKRDARMLNACFAWVDISAVLGIRDERE